MEELRNRGKNLRKGKSFRWVNEQKGKLTVDEMRDSEL